MNQKSFIALIDPFQNKMFRLARRLLTSSEEAQDAVQEVVLKLWKKRDDLSAYRSVEALAMTMTKNYSYDQLKAKRSNNLKIVHSNYEDVSQKTGLQVEVADDVNSVFEMMKKLPEQQRAILQLRDVEQYTNPEIAEMLDMNETAVRVALSRARKTIREQLIKKHNYGIG